MSSQPIRLVLPTGRMHQAVLALLERAGLSIPRTAKNYRPQANDDRFEVKLMKPANIPTLLDMGSHDIGFSGLDWVRETGSNVETLLDTEILPVRLVSAAPVGAVPFERTDRPLVVASEYERLTREYMTRRGVEWTFLRTYGATEVFPPEDADMIVDNTATGSALAANHLEAIDLLLRSTTWFIASPQALRRPEVRRAVDDLCLLLRGALDADKRVLLEMNVDGTRLDAVVELLPAMKAPTVQPLYGNGEYAVKAAVPRDRVAQLIPQLRAAGASDILETDITRVIS